MNAIEQVEKRFRDGMMTEQYERGHAPEVCILPSDDYMLLKINAQQECIYKNTSPRVSRAEMSFLGVDCYQSEEVTTMVFGYGP